MMKRTLVEMQEDLKREEAKVVARRNPEPEGVVSLKTIEPRQVEKHDLKVGQMTPNTLLLIVE